MPVNIAAVCLAVRMSNRKNLSFFRLALAVWLLGGRTNRIKPSLLCPERSPRLSCFSLACLFLVWSRGSRMRPGELRRRCVSLQ